MKTSELIRHRRSVRSFDGMPLKDEDLNSIIACSRQADNPYGLPIEWRLLDAEKDPSLSVPVVTGTSSYIAGKMAVTAHAEEAFGYSFEKIVLHASSLGIGTTWIAGTMDRSSFERAMELAAGEVMPCISPLGYPAARMSLRETLMRKGIRADSRKNFEELFFDGSFRTPLTREKAGRLEPLLEGVRLAPSAVNHQPWRVLIRDNKAHFYLKKSRGMSAGGWDVQKIDIGIALCHFAMMAEECAIPVTFALDDPGITADEGLIYVASYGYED